MSSDRVFVFADLAGYTALTEAHGDADAAEIAIRFHALARAQLPASARIVKTIGDAIMVVAVDACDAIAVAVDLMRSVRELPAFPAIRVGLHAGPAVEHDGDYFGAAVNVAARVTTLAKAGEIVCTETVARVAVERALAGARPMGTFRLKNVALPVAAFELNPHEPIGALRHIDPVCRMQVVADTAPTLTKHDGTTFYFCSMGCAARFKAEPEVYVPKEPGIAD